MSFGAGDCHWMTSSMENLAFLPMDGLAGRFMFTMPGNTRPHGTGRAPAPPGTARPSPSAEICMTDTPGRSDAATLERFGYAQELKRQPA